LVEIPASFEKKVEWRQEVNPLVSHPDSQQCCSGGSRHQNIFQGSLMFLGSTKRSPARKNTPDGKDHQRNLHGIRQSMRFAMMGLFEEGHLNQTPHIKGSQQGSCNSHYP